MALRTIVASIIVIGLVAAISASAQQLVSTELDVSVTEPENMGAWDGQVSNVRLEVDLCWDDAGGANPEGGSYLVDLGATGAPDWVIVSLDPEQLEFTPPTTSTEGDCTGAETATLTLEAPDGVRANETFDVDIALDVSPDDDTGTFQAPGNERTGITVTTVDAPGGAPGDDDNGEDPDDGDDPSEENGSPAPGVLVFVAIAAAMYLLRRRRGKQSG